MPFSIWRRLHPKHWTFSQLWLRWRHRAKWGRRPSPKRVLGISTWTTCFRRPLDLGHRPIKGFVTGSCFQSSIRITKLYHRHLKSNQRSDAIKEPFFNSKLQVSESDYLACSSSTTIDNHRTNDCDFFFFSDMHDTFLSDNDETAELEFSNVSAARSTLVRVDSMMLYRPKDFK